MLVPMQGSLLWRFKQWYLHGQPAWMSGTVQLRVHNFVASRLAHAAALAS